MRTRLVLQSNDQNDERQRYMLAPGFPRGYAPSMTLLAAIITEQRPDPCLELDIVVG